MKHGRIKIPTEMHPLAEIAWSFIDPGGGFRPFYRFVIANGWVDGNTLAADKPFKFQGWMCSALPNGIGQATLEEVERDARGLLKKRESEWDDFRRSGKSWPDYISRFGVKWDLEMGLPPEE